MIFPVAGMLLTGAVVAACAVRLWALHVARETAARRAAAVAEGAAFKTLLEGIAADAAAFHPTPIWRVTSFAYGPSGDIRFVKHCPVKARLTEAISEAVAEIGFPVVDVTPEAGGMRIDFADQHGWAIIDRVEDWHPDAVQQLAMLDEAR